ncbi:hypothetical protein ACFLQ6_09000 [Thermoproteota archaeon]
MDFLEKRGFEVSTPSGLIEFQKNAGKDDEYKILDLLQEYILDKHGTYNSLNVRYSKLRTFFRRNRATLPDDGFKIKADRAPIQDKLSVDVIRSLISIADLGFKAFYLTLWMGIMDQERFRQFNEKYGFELGRHIREKGVEAPFLVDFAGRKQSKNKVRFHTYLGMDALCAWREYFDRVRGYPKEGEAALVSGKGEPYIKDSLANKHLRSLTKLNYIKRSSGRNIRYGFGLHNFRDAAKTLLHLEGKKDSLDLDCVDYWMGHITDPNQYDKFYMDKAYTLEQYRIAEKYLNIISGIQSTPTQDTKELAQQIIKNPEAFKVLQDAMVEIVGAKLAPIERERKR